MKYASNFLFLFIIQICLNASRVFKYYSYDEITEIFQNLSKTCPQYIKIDTSQRRYNLPSGGKCGKSNTPCQNLIVFMTDFSTREVERPQIYISGLLHGDEVIGATTLTEFALYFCSNHGKDDWVLDLLKKVYFVFTPFTNAFGFSHEEREDFVKFNNDMTGLIDPNRDFPYFNRLGQFSESCMMTITARTINELFKEHIFVNSITFHGGANSIGYPWGNEIHLVTSHQGTEAPDSKSLKQIGGVLKKFTSSREDYSIPDYQLGDMNEITYPVDGGMEDWAYAASWENNNFIKDLKINPIKQCNPNTFGGYNQNATLYNNSTARTLIYLVETANMKKPYEYELGSDENIFDMEGRFFGHIPRNMRLVASAADIIKTSIRIDNLEKIEDKFYFNYKPMGCIEIENVGLYKIQFKSLDQVGLKFFKHLHKHTHDVIHNFIEFLLSYEQENDIAFPDFDFESINNVTCFWNYDQEGYKQNNTVEINYQKYFNLEDKINFDKKKSHGLLYFVAGTHPDASWQTQNNPDPNVPPQSHLVQTKSKTPYSTQNDNFVLQSSSHVSSNPVLLLQNGHLIEIDDYESLYLSNESLNLQTTIVDINSNIISDTYSVKSEVYISIPDDLRSKTKSSQFSFDLNIRLIIFSKNKNLSMSLNETDIFKKIKMKLLLNTFEPGINLIENNCSFHYFNNQTDVTTYYVECIPLELKNVNMNFIRNQLLSSLIHLELNLDNEKNSLIGAFNLANKEYTGKYISSDNVVCMSNFNRNFVSLLYNKDNSDILNNEMSHLNYKINFNKVSQLIWNVSFDFIGPSKEKFNKNILIQFSSSFSIKFSEDEINNKTEKTIKLPLQTANLIGTILNVYLYSNDLAVEDIIKQSKKFYYYNCTLIEKRIIDKEDFDAFFIFDKIDVSKPEEDYHFKIIISTCVILIIVIFLGLFYYYRKVRRNAYRTLNNEGSEEVPRDYFYKNRKLKDLRKIQMQMRV